MVGARDAQNQHTMYVLGLRLGLGLGLGSGFGMLDIRPKP